MICFRKMKLTHKVIKWRTSWRERDQMFQDETMSEKEQANAKESKALIIGD